MDTPNLLVICVVSFAAVLIILSIFSLIMHYLLIIFPYKSQTEDDTTIIAAITAAYNTNFPGIKISKIGENDDFHKRSQKD